MPSSTEQLLDVNEKNISGATPLELASQQGHMPVVRFVQAISL